MAKRKVNTDTGEIESVVVRHPHSRVRVVANCACGSLTEQSHKESCSVNRIMDTYKRTGALPPTLRVPNYGDVSHLNLPFDQLVAIQRETQSRLVKFSDEQKEKIRLDRIARRKKDEEDLAAYRASLAAVDKNNATAADSSAQS